MSRTKLPKDKIVKPTSFAISPEERKQMLLDLYLEKTKTKIGAYVRKLLKEDQPNRIREIEKSAKDFQKAEATSAKYGKTSSSTKPKKL